MKKAVLFTALVLLTSFVLIGTCAAGEPLTFDQRVKAQEAVERVYYSHRTWPADNPSPKPAFEEAFPKQALEAKVRDYLERSYALEKYWQKQIDGAQLQAELERVTRNSKDPAVLREIFSALGNEPALVAECLVRPILADRLLRASFSADPALHGKARKEAESAMEVLRRGGTLSDAECLAEEVRYVPENSAEALESQNREGKVVPLAKARFGRLLENSAPGRVFIHEQADSFVLVKVLSSDAYGITLRKYYYPKNDFDSWWSRATRSMGEPPLPGIPSCKYFIPESGPQPLAMCPDNWVDATLDDIPDPRYGHTAVWTGTEMVVWGGGNNSGGKYNPATDSWVPTSRQSGVPSARTYHTAVWTGTEMIIWGGWNESDALQNGGRYNPATDSWTPTSLTTPCPGVRKKHVAVWTGTEMVVWGGADSDDVLLNDGGKYDPVGDTWTTLSTAAPCPEARQYATAVYISGEMIVWGGSATGDVALNSGGRYNPATDTWISATSILGDCPVARRFHSAVAANGEMIIWGGEGTGLVVLGTGSRYNPGTDTWTVVNASGAPAVRRNHSAVWTGSLMIIWGGEDGSSSLQSGGKYDPASNTWSATSTGAGCPTARYQHTAVWTGTEMIIWGGYWPTNSGARYNPVLDTWSATALGTNVPAGRQYHTAVWTGAEMIVWGGESLGPTLQLNTGGRYTPATDSWAATSTLSPCPVGRRYHTAVWTGTDMIVWGGDYYDGSDHYLNSGALYNPGTDQWSATASTGAPTARHYHTAVWTGTEMIIWGGHSGSAYLATGSRYNPATSTWTATYTTGAPTLRQWHSAVWTGTYMIIWGGFNGAAGLSTGSAYNPTTNNWAALSATGVPAARYKHSAVWAPDLNSMIVWGGGTTTPFNTGGVYNMKTAKWIATSTVNAPSARIYHTAVWTGQEMLVWGGQSGAVSLDDGARLNAFPNTWTTMSRDPGFPTPRFVHTAVWTGKTMIVWGGSGAFSSGGIYEPPPQIVGLYEACGAGPVTLTTADYATYHWLKDGVEIGEVTRTGLCNVASSGSESTVTNLTPAVPFNVGDVGKKITIDGQECNIKGFTTDTIITIEEVVDKSGVSWSILDKTAHARSYDATETGDYNVRVTLPDMTVCEGVPHHVDCWGYPAPEITGSSSGCEEPGVTLGTSSFSAYQWILNGSDITSATTQTYTADVAGNYQVRVTDSHGCVGTSAVFPLTIFENPVPTVTATSEGCPTRLATEEWVTYQWKLGAAAIPGATSREYVATANGSYTVTVTDSNGCAGTSAAAVISNYPVPTITGVTTGCEGSTVTLSTGAYASFQWYIGGVLIPGATSQTYITSVSGTYTVEVTDTLGCTGISPTGKTVTFYPPPSPTITGPSGTVCTADLSTQSFSAYQWILDGTDITGANSRTYSTAVAGTYNVRVTDSRGCVGTSADFIVTVFPPPTPPTVLGPTSGCGETGVTLSTGVYSTYQWYVNGTAISGATSQSYLTTETGFNYYTVSVTDINGCAASSSNGLWINLDPPRPDVYIDQDKYWITNGNVHALSQSGTTLYMGGEFTYVGPYTGSGVVMDPTSGARNADWPKVNGPVYAIAPDGTGGFYMGGAFTKVGGYSRSNFVHLKSDKSVDQDFVPSANGNIWAILVVGTKVYIGGEFTAINLQIRNRIAAFDTSSAQLTAWNPNITGGAVYSLCERNGKIYVGGAFSAVGGATYNRLVSIDANTALADTWNPNIGGIVRVVKTLDSRLFIGGDFTTASSTARNRLAAFDLSTGLLITTWNPNSGGNIYAMDIYDNGAGTATIYVGGSFTTMNGQTRNRIAALDANATATPWVTTWDPNITGASGVNVTAVKVSADGSTVYVGGFFTTVKGAATRSNIASIDASAGTPNAMDPVAGVLSSSTTCVRALAVYSTNLAVGGDFTSVNGVLRNRLAAIDMTTGQATSWNPSIAGTGSPVSVYAMAQHGGNLYIGGAFTIVGGATRNRLASFNMATGALNTWDGNAASIVRALLVSGDIMYVGGEFLTISGTTTRNRLASFDLTTGSLTTFYPNMNGVVRTLGMSGTTLYAGGDFTLIGGTGGSARNRLAGIDTTTGLATTWDPNMGGVVRSIVVGTDVVWAGGDFTTVTGGTVTRQRIAAIDILTGAATSWNPAAGGIVYTISASDDKSVIYAGGAFTTIGGATRIRIAAIDAVAGTALPNWEPGADGIVYTMFQSPPAMLFGGAFANVRGLKHSYFGAAPLATTQCNLSFQLSTDNFASYQWIQDGVTITGAASQAYTASDPGLFKVRVTRAGGCIGESSELKLWTAECGGPSCTAPSDRVVETVSAGSINWSDIAGADYYRVVRAVRADLAAYNFVCFAGSYGIASGTAGADISQHDPSGEAGRCYYYIVQGYDCQDPDEYLGPAGDGVVERTLAATTCDGD